MLLFGSRKRVLRKFCNFYRHEKLFVYLYMYIVIIIYIIALDNFRVYFGVSRSKKVISFIIKQEQFRNNQCTESPVSRDNGKWKLKKC